MSDTAWREALLQRIGAAIESLAEAYPRGYLLLAAGVALAGYGWLLLFPWLVLAGVSGGYEALTDQSAIVWSHLLVWSAVAAGAALVTWRIARFRPALPPGIVLDRNKTPALFDLVRELYRHYRRPWIDRLIITGAFELELVKTPCCGLPLWSVNTLAIGLPLMQSLSPVQFRCLLARRMGQFSKRHNTLGNWLYQLRRIWPQYAITSGCAGHGYQPVGLFFSVFAPLYSWVSLPAARLDELAADSYAMEVCSDEEVLDAITTETVCRLYLEEKYWPVYERLSATTREAMPKPHTGMVSVLRAGLQGDRSQPWLMKSMDQEPRLDETLPSLAQRMDNIGHLRTHMGEIAASSAAVACLGTAVEELDKALGSASPHRPAQESNSRPFRFQPPPFMSSLSRRLRRRDTPQDTAVVGNHSQVTSPQ
jgi:hypothetical protein